MKRTVWMSLVVLGLAGLMQAQSSSNKMELSGTVCKQACVTGQGANSTPTCDPQCTLSSGPTVLVDDAGNIKKIANEEMCQSHMGKHVKMTAVRNDQPSAAASPTEKQREESLRVMEIHNDSGGGM